jgi:hypothetical protein
MAQRRTGDSKTRKYWVPQYLLAYASSSLIIVRPLSGPPLGNHCSNSFHHLPKFRPIVTAAVIFLVSNDSLSNHTTVRTIMNLPGVPIDRVGDFDL